ncbi:MAG: immunoglobulin domain-containing protein [Candidatus Korobacteraceae bacterium]
MTHPRFLVLLLGCTLSLGLTACGGMSGTPPTITTQPQNQTVPSGMTATFSVTASGSMPLSYQWMENGMTIAGATSASYTTPPTTLADNNSVFAVVVSNHSGSVTSNSATLRVLAVP